MTKTIQLSCLFLNQTFNPNDHYWKLKSYSLLTGQIPKNESNENITINSIIKVTLPSNSDSIFIFSE